MAERWRPGDLLRHRRGGYHRVVLEDLGDGYLWGYPAPLACENVWDSRNSTDPDLTAPWEGGYELVGRAYVAFAGLVLRG